MSEPTSGGNQTPGSDPTKDPEPGRNPGDVRDQPSDAVFSDPTAPVWADPTAPIATEPPAPTPPGAGPAESAGTAAGPQSTPPPATPHSNPYAQPPPTVQQSYGEQQAYSQQPSYSQQPAQPYGQPPAGPQYPAYGQQGYATGAPTEANTSAIVLTVLSGISIFVGNLVAIGSLILGIVALTKNTTDHEGSRRLTKIGWIVFAVAWALGVLLIIGIALVVAVSIHNGNPNPSFGN